MFRRLIILFFVIQPITSAHLLDELTSTRLAAASSLAYSAYANYFDYNNPEILYILFSILSASVLYRYCWRLSNFASATRRFCHFIAYRGRYNIIDLFTTNVLYDLCQRGGVTLQIPWMF